jgi:hypothetical protein
MEYIEDGEFFQYIDVYPDGTFENHQILRRYTVNTLNSIVMIKDWFWFPKGRGVITWV